jgi:hypothetical protein
MKPHTWICLTLAACWLGGCSYVLSEAPMGAAPVPLDPAAWSGYWCHGCLEGGCGELTIDELCGVWQATVGARGALELRRQDLPAPGFSVDVRLELQIRPSGEADWWLASLPCAGDCLEDLPDAAGTYRWGLLYRRGDLVLVYQPAPELFAEPLLEGRLPGEYLGDGSFLLHALSAEQIERLFEDGDRPLPYFAPVPLVFSRLATAPRRRP